MRWCCGISALIVFVTIARPIYARVPQVSPTHSRTVERARKREVPPMSNPKYDALREKLKSAILGREEIEAETLVKQMGEEATSVLAELAQSPDRGIRDVIVGLASRIRSPDACRLLLRMLVDADHGIRSLAAAQIPLCSKPEIIAELRQAAKDLREPSTRGALARAIGEAGTSADIEFVQKLRGSADPPELIRDIDAALARLGDEKALAALVERLTRGGASTRMEALQDCVYVGRTDLVRHFGPALQDHTDMTALSIPEDPPMKYARVADIAVFAMVQLGIRLSFSMELLERLEDAQLAEASRYVAQRAETK